MPSHRNAKRGKLMTVSGALWRRGGVVVSASDFRSDARNVGGSRPGWSLHCCVVSLDKKLCSNQHCLSSPRCINGYQRHTARGNLAKDYHPILGGVAILLVASCYRTGLSSGCVGHLSG